MPTNGRLSRPEGIHPWVGGTVHIGRWPWPKVGSEVAVRVKLLEGPLGVTRTVKADVAAGGRSPVPANAGLFGDPAESSHRGSSCHDSPRREKRRR